MKLILHCCLIFLLLGSCNKEHDVTVDIYELKSFSVAINQATNPATVSITNAVLSAEPLVADRDIKFYTQSTTTFTLRKEIKPIIQNFSSDKAFTVTVNSRPVYFGKFHPAYLSSITFGLATIDPVLSRDRELAIQFATVTGSPDLQQLDKRNDDRLINALKATDRLR